MNDKEQFRLLNKVKELEVALSNLKLEHVDLARKQSIFNLQVNTNMNAIGRKLFPEQYEEAREGIIQL